MTIIMYHGIKLHIEQNAVISNNAWHGFLSNAWNYTKSKTNKTPEAFFTKNNPEYDYQSYSFISYDTNFGWLRNQSMDNDNNTTKIDALQALRNTLNANNEPLPLLLSIERLHTK